jgi:hypothetical protein
MAQAPPLTLIFHGKTRHLSRRTEESGLIFTALDGVVCCSMTDSLSLAISAGTAHPYHETFWVVTGSAAPVIMLAAIVAFGQLQTPDVDGVPRAVVTTISVGAAILSSCFVTQFLALSRALDSLSQERDTARLGEEKRLIVLGLFLLLAASFWAVSLSPMIFGGKRSREAKQSKSDAASADVSTLLNPPDQRSGE